jgi:hypothetical protein
MLLTNCPICDSALNTQAFQPIDLQFYECSTYEHYFCFALDALNIRYFSLSIYIDGKELARCTTTSDACHYFYDLNPQFKTEPILLTKENVICQYNELQKMIKLKAFI